MRSKNDCLIEMAKRICGIDMGYGIPSYFHPDVTPELVWYDEVTPFFREEWGRMKDVHWGRPRQQIIGVWKDELMPKHIIFNGVTTVCIFHDGTKVISRPQKGENFDKETGVAMCIAKYIYGSRSKFLKAVEKGKTQ